MIYLDCAATTRPCAEAVAAVTSALTEKWGNPSSTHRAGLDARRSLDSARAVILSSLGVRRDGELIFTSSGTESNDLATLGVCRSKSRRGRIIVTEGEHASVFASAKQAEAEGFELVTIPTRGGELDMDTLRHAVTPDTVLVSHMLVNSETGARYDVESAFRLVRAASPNAVCHCDAVQGYMKIPFTAASLGADLITVSAHKIHGPKGAAALYISSGVLRRRAISPVIFGGGQESGLRSGTVNVPAILGFAAAVERASKTAREDAERMNSLRCRAIENLMQADLNIRPNLPPVSAPHILSITLPGIKSETALNYLSAREICISSGSACSTHSKNISRALLAFGLSEREADTTVRMSLCRDTTEDEIDEFTAALTEGVRTLAKMK